MLYMIFVFRQNLAQFLVQILPSLWFYATIHIKFWNLLIYLLLYNLCFVIYNVFFH